MRDCSTVEGKMEAEDLVTYKYVREETFDKGSAEHKAENGMEVEIQKALKNELRKQMQEIKQDVLNRVNNLMNDMVTELVQVANKLTSKGNQDLADSEIYCNRIKAKGEDALPPKKFLRRNSLLTDLYEIKHIRTIYTAAVAALVLLFVRTVVYDIRHTGAPNIAIGTIQRGFGKFPTVLLIWTFMQCSTLVAYAAFCKWANLRLCFSPKSFTRKIWDYGWLVTLIAYQITFIMLPTKALLREELPVASSMIILMEQVRFVMKTYAFVRSVAPRFLSYKPHSDTPVPKPPGFSKYLYFLFVPTLIYQDDYPRTRTIRWNLMLINFGEVLTVLAFIAILYERVIEPSFLDFGKQPVDLLTIFLGLLEAIMPGIILFVCGFYLLLHCWMNAFAELMRFADRMFYKDWWNSIGYSAYYRTWNIVVHDWLYTYIYRDMYEILVPRNKKLATIAVFALSAIFHEYILCVAFRFFFPVMLLLFGGMGTVLLLVKRSGNLFFWISLCLGSGMLDWWNSIGYSAYYRTWNIVVHDWLYTYIYRDMYEILVPRNKKLATIAVFALSAIFHEYILCVAFRFFFPVMLLLFGGMGTVLLLVKRSGNLFFWISLCLDSGMLVSLYLMEHFARIN